MLSQSPEFSSLQSCYIHADGDDMATQVLSRDLLPAQHWISSLWLTSAITEPVFIQRKRWKEPVDVAVMQPL